MLITALSNISILNGLSSIDPTPFFILSLVPYLAFLFFLRKTLIIPKISILGFQLTLLFVFMTIVFAIFAKLIYSDELTNIDPLHGAAESFLTISDAVIVLGFIPLLKKEVKNS
tara:strand:- start:5236 stop:5577 length:342 start_codon:yes stop_codon:yes gene_type:complete